MIAYLEGEILTKNEAQVVIKVNGVGYTVELPPGIVRQLPDLGQTTALHIHYYVRDSEVRLFGFQSRDELLVFSLAITVKGVGPKLAQSIVAKLSTGQFRLAIRREDTAILVTVPRLNKNIAHTMVMALKKKIESTPFETELDIQIQTKPNDDAVKALVGLGSSPEAASQAVVEAQRVLGISAKLEDLTRLSLRYLSRNLG